MALQVALVFHDYWSDDETLARRMIELDTGEIADGLSVGPDGRPRFVLPSDVADRYGIAEEIMAGDGHPRPGGEGESDPDNPDEIADGYYLRIRTGDGVVLHSNCAEDCVEHFLPLTVNPPSFWQREIEPGKPITVAGAGVSRWARDWWSWRSRWSTIPPAGSGRSSAWRWSSTCSCRWRSNWRSSSAPRSGPCSTL